MRLLSIFALVALLALPCALPAQSGWNDWNDDDFGDSFFDDVRSSAGRLWEDVQSRWDEWTDDPFERPGTSSYSRPRSNSYSAEIRRDRRPWSGDWWPRASCGLVFKDTGQGLSPLEKYDTIVFNMYGRLAGACAWEADPNYHHNDGPRHGANWAGHCNGLAAAAILSPEPRSPIDIPLQRQVVTRFIYPNARSCPSGLFRDGRNDYRLERAGFASLRLSVDDMKGWLAEVYMNCRTQQVGYGGNILGNRYNEHYINPDDPTYQDIYPHNYHYLLDSFINKKHQAFVAEIDPHSPVNNHPVWKYDCSMSYGRGYIHCRTKVYMTDYAPRSNFVGTDVLTRTYEYILYQDSSGRIRGGKWIGSSVNKHPDFVWIPIGDARATGTRENPQLNADFIAYLFRTYGAYGGWRSSY